MRDKGNELKTLISYYVLFCQAEGKSTRTVRWYRQKLEYFANFLREHGCATQIEEIDGWQVRNFVRWLQTEVRVGGRTIPIGPLRIAFSHPTRCRGTCEPFAPSSTGQFERGCLKKPLWPR